MTSKTICVGALLVCTSVSADENQRLLGLATSAVRHLQGNQLGPAEAELDEVTAAVSSPILIYYQGHLALRKGELAAARDHFERFLQQESNAAERMQLEELIALVYSLISAPPIHVAGVRKAKGTDARVMQRTAELFNQAQAAAQKGRFTLAAQQYRSLLSTFPNAPERKDVEERLATLMALSNVSILDKSAELAKALPKLTPHKAPPPAALAIQPPAEAELSNPSTAQVLERVSAPPASARKKRIAIGVTLGALAVVGITVGVLAGTHVIGSSSGSVAYDHRDGEYPK